MDPEEGTDPRTSISFAPSSEYDLVLFSRFSIGSSWFESVNTDEFLGFRFEVASLDRNIPSSSQPETFGVSSVCSNVPCRPARFDKCT